MISEKKLQGLAKIVSEDWDNIETPTDAYTKLVEYSRNQREYFHEYLKLNNFIKLVIYIYFLKTEGSFDNANQVINNLEFVTLLSHEGQNYEEECQDCYGNGRISCEYCGNSGEVDCSECDGSGEVTCPECDGSGEIETSDDSETCKECQGEGEVKCSECDNGQVTCGNCDGEGDEECGNCDGNGHIETDNIIYTIHWLIIWNPELKFMVEKTFESVGPLMEVNQLSNYEKGYILADIDDDNNSEFNDDVRDNTYYTLDLTDEPERAHFTSSGRIRWNYNDFNFEELTY